MIWNKIVIAVVKFLLSSLIIKNKIKHSSTFRQILEVLNWIY